MQIRVCVNTRFSRRNSTNQASSPAISPVHRKLLLLAGIAPSYIHHNVVCPPTRLHCMGGKSGERRRRNNGFSEVGLRAQWRVGPCSLCSPPPMGAQWCSFNSAARAYSHWMCSGAYRAYVRRNCRMVEAYPSTLLWPVNVLISPHNGSSCTLAHWTLQHLELGDSTVQRVVCKWILHNLRTSLGATPKPCLIPSLLLPGLSKRLGPHYLWYSTTCRFHCLVISTPSVWLKRNLASRLIYH